MSDIKFNCPACGQSLEAPTEMAGQLIDCPTCKKSLEIPIPPRPMSPIPTRPVVRQAPSAKPPAQRTLLRDRVATPSSVPAPSTRATSPGLVVAFFILAFLCAGLAGGMIFLIKSRNASNGTAQGTPVAPTKENALLARQSAEKETLIEKALPDMNLNGEIFIVTKGGQSIKLGLVEVALIPIETLKPYLDRKHDEMTNAVAQLEPRIEEAMTEMKRLDKERDAAFQKSLDVMRNGYGNYYAAKHAYENAQEAANKAMTSWSQLLREKNEYMSGSFYFDSLPLPLRATKTNSDGRFRLLIPAAGRFAVAATALRHVVDEVEHYYWLIEVDPKGGQNQTIMLSNDNMTSAKGSESLIRTL